MSSVPQHPQLVLEVTTIDTVIKESFPPQVQSTVYGTVPSTGWLQPYLAPYTYVQAPPDGIYEFDFVAFPPQGGTAKVITPIRATLVWPQGALGIRVYASTNVQESLLDAANVSRAEP
jgi:hypothetical protein